MQNVDPCIICNQAGAITFEKAGADSIEQRCVSCGRFQFSSTALAIYRNNEANPLNIRKLKGWILDKNRSSNTPTITSETLKSIYSMNVPSVKERSNIILLECYKNEDYLGKKYKIDENILIPSTYSTNYNELHYLLDYLESQNFITKNLQNSTFTIQPAGYEILEKLKNPINTSSNFAFVAMSFDEKLRSLYTEGISIAIMDAGYTPLRVDQQEYVGRIDDEILAGIQKSRFIVADFTGHKAGVYFEAGFSMGLGIPIVWTCSRDDIKNLHFDIRQYNCIVWDDITSLKLKLYNRITALM